ncbi:MAG: hypothetical protein M1833_001425 [Piccolia ochrophora]|nr:MAG: hypothetical protein M1833_001425 [Piccolia ochrophora]
MGPQAHYHTAPIKVTVGKGQDARVFYVHEAHLTRTSEFFKTCLHSHIEELTHEVPLPDDDPAAFDLFVQWLYYDDYHVSAAVPRDQGATDDTYYMLHVKAYTLANKIVAPIFQRRVVEKLAQVLEQYTDIDMATLLNMAEDVYEGTADDAHDEMRSILALYCASRTGQPSYPEYGDPRRFFRHDELRMLANCEQPQFIADVLQGVNSRRRLHEGELLEHLQYRAQRTIGP